MGNLGAVRERFQTITDRFAGFQAQWLNVHVDFPLLQRLAQGRPMEGHVHLVDSVDEVAALLNT